MLKKLFTLTLFISSSIFSAPNFIITNVFDRPIYIAIGDSKNDPLKAEVKRINPKETFSVQVDMKSLPSFMIAPFNPVPGDRVFVYEFNIPKPSITTELIQQATSKAITGYEQIFKQQMQRFGLSAETIQNNFEQLKKNPQQNSDLNNLINSEIAKLLPKSQYAEYESAFRNSLENKNIIFAINFANKGKIIAIETRERKYLYQNKEYSEEEIKKIKPIDIGQITLTEGPPRIQTFFSTIGYEPVLIVPSRWFPRTVNEVSADSFQRLITVYPLCFDCDALKILAHIHGYDSIKLGENAKILGIMNNYTTQDRDLAYKILKNGIYYLLLSENKYYQNLFYHLIEIIQNAYKQLGGQLTIEDAALRQKSREKESEAGLGKILPPTKMNKPILPSLPSMPKTIEMKPFISLAYAQMSSDIALKVAKKITNSLDNINEKISSLEKLSSDDMDQITVRLRNIYNAAQNITVQQIQGQASILESNIKELNSIFSKLRLMNKINPTEYNDLYAELQAMNSVF